MNQRIHIQTDGTISIIQGHLDTNKSAWNELLHGIARPSQTIPPDTEAFLQRTWQHVTTITGVQIWEQIGDDEAA